MTQTEQLKQYRLVLETRTYIVRASCKADALMMHHASDQDERCVEIHEVKS